MRGFCATQRSIYGAEAIMSRRVKRPLHKRAPGDRPKGSRPYREGLREARPHPQLRAQRTSKPASGKQSFEARPRRAPQDDVARADTTPDKVEPPPLPTKVQTVAVT